jgi:hypothetical protein
MASFRYLTTELFALPYIYCDEMRVELAMPRNRCLRVKNKEIWYMCFETDSKTGAFLEFMTNGTLDFQSRASEDSFVIFRDKKERNAFEAWLTQNIQEMDKIPESEIGVSIQNRVEKAGNNFIFKPVEMMKFKDLFEYWKDCIST